MSMTWSLHRTRWPRRFRDWELRSPFVAHPAPQWPARMSIAPVGTHLSNPCAARTGEHAAPLLHSRKCASRGVLCEDVSVEAIDSCIYPLFTTRELAAAMQYSIQGLNCDEEKARASPRIVAGRTDLQIRCLLSPTAGRSLSVLRVLACKRIGVGTTVRLNILNRRSRAL